MGSIIIIIRKYIEKVTIYYYYYLLDFYFHRIYLYIKREKYLSKYENLHCKKVGTTLYNFFIFAIFNHEILLCGNEKSMKKAKETCGAK